MNERVVAKIRKSATKEIWVVLTEYSGELRLDIRERFLGDEGAFLPSKRGVTIPATEFPKLHIESDSFVDLTGLFANSWK